MRFEYVTIIHDEKVEADLRAKAAGYLPQPPTEEQIQETLRRYWRYRQSRLIEQSYCCKAMRESVLEGIVEFYPSHLCLTSKEPSLYLILTDSDEYDSVEDVPVRPRAFSFCPFCGERVECVEVKRMRSVRKEVTETRTRTEFGEEEIP